MKIRSLKTGKVLFILGILFLIASLGYIFKIYGNVVVKKTNDPVVTTGPSPTPDPLRIRNILLLGYAGGDHDGATLTDTIVLARIYPRENRIILISIPRDIWVPIPVSEEKSEHYKINHAFAIGLDDKKYPDKNEKYTGLYGAGTLVRETVETVTGIYPENFIAVNFDGFKSVVNALGGVEVNVPYSFEDKYYPIKGLEKDTCGKEDDEVKALTATMSGDLLEKEFPCRYEVLNFTKGKTTMDGDTALKFVRSRHSDINGNDFGRAIRQQAFLLSIKAKLLNIGSIPKIVSLITTLSKNVITDIDLKTAFRILSEQETISDFEINSISLTTENILIESQSSDRQYILIPKEGEDNWKSVHDFIKENI